MPKPVSARRQGDVSVLPAAAGMWKGWLPPEDPNLLRRHSNRWTRSWPAKLQPLPIQHGIKATNLYLVSLRGVYPVTNVRFGVTAYHAAKAPSCDDRESAERPPKMAGSLRHSFITARRVSRPGPSCRRGCPPSSP